MRRQVCHRLHGGGKHNYEALGHEYFITRPRLRSPTALTYHKWEDLAEDEAECKKERKTESLSAYQLKARAQALQSLNWDKQRASALVLLYRAFKLDDLKRDVTYDGELVPFDDLPIDLQYKLMQGARRAVQKFIQRAAENNRIEALEFAKFRVERKHYLKGLDAALAHPRFTEVALALA